MNRGADAREVRRRRYRRRRRDANFQRDDDSSDLSEDEEGRIFSLVILIFITFYHNYTPNFLSVSYFNSSVQGKLEE